MLDSLRSMLTRTSLSSFLTCCDEYPHRDERAIMTAADACLKVELGRLDSEKKLFNDSMLNTIVVASPIFSAAGAVRRLARPRLLQRPTRRDGRERAWGRHHPRAPPSPVRSL